MKTPTPFLRTVADCYLANESDGMIDLCFVTPNKRSGVFLTKHFSDAVKDEGASATVLPRIISISDFIGEFSDGVEASRIEQLLILYNVYAQVISEHMTDDDRKNGDKLVDFNRFQFWGDILLNDFNDVDRFMVDARALFKNVENLKEISANFLTEEQIEVIRRYWNDDLVPQPVKDFWNHIVHVESGDSADKKNVAGFVKLWQVMYEIYVLFRERLSAAGLTYSGKTYRDACEAICSMEPDDFPYVKYVFVGFNVLSKAERDIFEHLQKIGVADFCWDYASPMFKVPGNRASRFMKDNVKRFPSAYGIGVDTLDYFPDVEVISLPSTVAQAKLLPTLLGDIHPEFFDDSSDDADISSLVDTAIVLPDEGLVQPVLAAMPEQVPVVNVTMGYTLRHTTISSLLRNIISLQLRAREVRSVGTFYYEDVIAVLSHPLIRRFYWRSCNEAVARINRERIFNVPTSFFDDPALSDIRPMFEVVSNANDPKAVISYLLRLLEWLESILQRVGVESTIATDFDLERVKFGSPTLELQFIRGYRDAIADLELYIATYLKNIFLEDKTVFHLVERIAGNQSVSYDGVPLEGLQVMGVLETRCLDFANLVIASMNERIFPRKHYAKTFIPNALRSGYGMSTVEHQESIYAYYFYRMISRAKRVVLLYDARTSGVRSGGPSRFINQIRYQFPPDKVKLRNTSFRLMSPESKTVTIQKNDHIMGELNRYRSETNPRALSASSINEYINCPVKFYLSHIERYYDENELNDYMDESTYGSIIHEVIERLYMDAKGELPEIEITDKLIAKLSDERLINKYLEESIRVLHYKRPADDPRPIEGDAAIYQKIMLRTIRRMFDREAEMADRVFFVKGEEPLTTRLRVNDNLTINFTFRIDRVDRVEPRDGSPSFIRLIDYKTGSDELKTTNVSATFDAQRSGNRPKAILQLLLYSNAYAQHFGYDGPIQPFIYSLRTVAVNPLAPLTCNRKPIVDYRELNDEFIDNLSNTLNDMFDPEVPFVASPSESHCKYCKFQEFCINN